MNYFSIILLQRTQKRLLKTLRERVHSSIIPIWKRGFLQSRYIHILEYSVPLCTTFKQILIYLTILKTIQDTQSNKMFRLVSKKYAIQRKRLNELVEHIKIHDKDFLPDFHPYFYCFLNNEYVFDNISCPYPIKISRTITICL